MAGLNVASEDAPHKLVSKCLACGHAGAPAAGEDWEDDVRGLFHIRCFVVSDVWGPNAIVEKPDLPFQVPLTGAQVKHLKSRLGLKRVDWAGRAAVMHRGELFLAWAIPAVKAEHNYKCWLIVVQCDPAFDWLRLLPERGAMKSVTFPSGVDNLAPWACAQCGSRDLLSFWAGGDWSGRVETGPLPTTACPMGAVAHLLALDTYFPHQHLAVNVADFAEVLIWYSSVLSMHAQQRDLHDALHAAVPGWGDMRIYVQLSCSGNEYRAYFVSPTQVLAFDWGTS